MARPIEPEAVERLTRREWEALQLLRRGLTNAEIAQELGISPDGAKYHVSEIIAKLGVRNRYEAASWPERRPWWLAALAPAGLLWRHARRGAVARLPSLAMGLSIALFAVILGVAGLTAFLLMRGTGDAEPPALSALATSTAPAPPGIAPSGSLLFRAQDNRDSDIYRVDADGSNLVNLTAHPALDGQAEWLPDGSAIAFSSLRTAATYTAGTPRASGAVYRGGSALYGSSDIYLMDPEGRIIRNVTNTPFENERLLSWSPDGSKILFGYFLDDDSEYWTMNADGTDRHLVLPNCNSTCTVFGWSPDGSRLLAFGDRQLFTMNWDGTDKTVLADLEGGYTRARWSPSGNTIAFTEFGEGAAETIWLIDGDGSNRRRIFAPLSMSALDWSPNEREIAVAGFEELWIVNVETGDARLLVNTGPGQASLPIWSPDGSLIAYTSRVGKFRDVFVISVSGGTPVNVSQGPLDDEDPRWSPDGRYLLFTSDRNSAAGIYSIRPDGSSVTLVAPTDPGQLSPPGIDPSSEPLIATPCASFIGPEPNVVQPEFRCGSPDLLLEARLVQRALPGGEGVEQVVEVIDRATGRPLPMEGGEISSFTPFAWSPDSSHLAFYASEDAAPYVFSMDVAEGSVTRLAEASSISYATKLLIWSPDGEYVYYSRGGGCGSPCWPGFLYRIRADGSGEPEQLTDLRVGEVYGWVP